MDKFYKNMYIFLGGGCSSKCYRISNFKNCGYSKILVSFSSLHLLLGVHTNLHVSVIKPTYTIFPSDML